MRTRTSSCPYYQQLHIHTYQVFLFDVNPLYLSPALGLYCYRLLLLFPLFNSHSQYQESVSLLAMGCSDGAK